MSLGNPSAHETSCLCRKCGSFLISLDQFCPTCGRDNPVYGHESIAEIEAKYEDKDDDYDDF